MFQRILLAVDSSEAGQLALSLSIAVAGCHSAEVRVIHVNSYQSPGRGLTPESDEQAFAIVDRAVMALLEDGIDATGVAAVATCSGVADRIAAEVADWGADVLIMGSSRKRGINRFFGRQVRRRVMAETNLPVLVAPAPLHIRRRGRVLDRRSATAVVAPTTSAGWGRVVPPSPRSTGSTRSTRSTRSTDSRGSRGSTGSGGGR